ncbi:MAG: hypothetical protein ACI8T1_003245 [Verrucomicrobiales bacterium]|jgi:hypothetical protein
MRGEAGRPTGLPARLLYPSARLYYFCVPICARIHEGIVLSNRDKRTLIDKANEMLKSVCKDLKFILLADAYYANGKMIVGAKARSCDLVTRVRKSTVAFEKAPVPKKTEAWSP